MTPEELEKLLAGQTTAAQPAAPAAAQPVVPVAPAAPKAAKADTAPRTKPVTLETKPVKVKTPKAPKVSTPAAVEPVVPPDVDVDITADLQKFHDLALETPSVPVLLRRMPDGFRQRANAQGVDLDSVFDARKKGRTFEEVARANRERGVIGFIPPAERAADWKATVEQFEKAKLGDAGEELKLKASSADNSSIPGMSGYIAQGTQEATKLPEVTKPGEYGYQIAETLVRALAQDKVASSIYDRYGRKELGGATVGYIQDRTEDLAKRTGLRASDPQFDEKLKALRRRATNEVIAYKTIGLWTPVILAKDIAVTEGIKDPGFFEALAPNIELVGFDNKRQAIFRQESALGVVFRAIDIPQEALVGARQALPDELKVEKSPAMLFPLGAAVQGVRGASKVDLGKIAGAAKRGIMSGASVMEDALATTEGAPGPVRAVAGLAGLAGSVVFPDMLGGLGSGKDLIKGALGARDMRRAQEAATLLKDAGAAYGAGDYVRAAALEKQLRDKYVKVADILDNDDAAVAEKLRVVNPELRHLDRRLTREVSEVLGGDSRTSAGLSAMHPSLRGKEMSTVKNADLKTSLAYVEKYDYIDHLKRASDDVAAIKSVQTANPDLRMTKHFEDQVDAAMDEAFGLDLQNGVISQADYDALASVMKQSLGQLYTDPKTWQRALQAAFAANPATAALPTNLRQGVYAKAAPRVVRQFDRTMKLADQLEAAVKTNIDSRRLAAELTAERLGVEFPKITVSPANLYNDVALKTPSGEPVNLTLLGQTYLLGLRRAQPNASFDDLYAQAAIMDRAAHSWAAQNTADPFRYFEVAQPDFPIGGAGPEFRAGGKPPPVPKPAAPTAPATPPTTPPVTPVAPTPTPRPVPVPPPAAVTPPAPTAPVVPPVRPRSLPPPRLAPPATAPAQTPAVAPPVPTAPTLTDAAKARIEKLEDELDAVRGAGTDADMMRAGEIEMEIENIRQGAPVEAELIDLGLPEPTDLTVPRAAPVEPDFAPLELETAPTPVTRYFDPYPVPQAGPPPKGYQALPNKGNNYERSWTAYLSGKDSPEIRAKAAERGDIGLLVTPYTASYLPQAAKYPVFAVDNGVFAKEGFNPEKFNALIDKLGQAPQAVKDKLLYVVAPDVLIKLPDGKVVGDAKGTLEQFKTWGPQIRAKGLPVALVAQNGLEDMIDEVPWGQFDVLFIGGSDDWKVGNLVGEQKVKWDRLFQAFRDHGVPIHMGRVSGPERLSQAAHDVGAATVDGTMLAVAPTQMMAKLENMLDRLNKGGANVADYIYPETGYFPDTEDMITAARDPRVTSPETLFEAYPGIEPQEAAGFVLRAKAERRRVWNEIVALRDGTNDPALPKLQTKQLKPTSTEFTPAGAPTPEQVAVELRRAREATAPVPPTPTPAAAPKAVEAAPTPKSVQDTARELLAQGKSQKAVVEATGLKQAEVKKLAAAVKAEARRAPEAAAVPEAEAGAKGMVEEADVLSPERAKTEGKAPIEVSEEGLKETLGDFLFGPEARDADMPRGWNNPFVPAEKTKVIPRNTPEISQAEANAKIESWKAEARRQGAEGKNSGKVVLSLFDASGEWSKPWREAGYTVFTFDLQTGDDIRKFSADYFANEFGDFGDKVFAILAAPPCTNFSGAGARWWKGMDAKGETKVGIELVNQTLATVEYFKPAVWTLENPVGRIKALTGLPEPTLSFNPHNFGNPYTKRTLLWGDFNPELPLANVFPTEGSRIHKLSGKDKYGRSLTPEGFAYAFFMANNAEALGDAKVIAREMRGVPEDLVQKAIDAGHEPDDIRMNIEDAFYQEQSPEEITAILEDMIANPVAKAEPVVEAPKAPEVEAADAKQAELAYAAKQAEQAATEKRLAEEAEAARTQEEAARVEREAAAQRAKKQAELEAYQAEQVRLAQERADRAAQRAQRLAEMDRQEREMKQRWAEREASRGEREAEAAAAAERRKVEWEETLARLDAERKAGFAKVLADLEADVARQQQEAAALRERLRTEDPVRARLEDLYPTSRPGSVKEVLRELRQMTDNESYQHIIDRLLQQGGRFQDATFQVVQAGDRLPADVQVNFGGSEGYIGLSHTPAARPDLPISTYVKGTSLGGLDSGTRRVSSVEAVLHELVHAATSDQIGLTRLLGERRTGVSDRVGELLTLHKQVVGEIKSRLGDADELAGISRYDLAAMANDPNELVAYGMTNARFQALLKDIKVERNKTLWTKFVEGVARLLGLQPGDESALAALIETTERIMDLSPEEIEATRLLVFPGSAKAETSVSEMVGAAPTIFRSLRRDVANVGIDRFVKDRRVTAMIDRLYGIAPTVEWEEVPERLRVAAGSRLNKAEKGLASGEITQAEFNTLVADVIADLNAQDALMRARRATAQRRRGADWVRSRLLQYKDAGVIDEAGAEMADWFIQQNPQLANDLGVSAVKGAPLSATAGEYLPGSRIVKLFKESGNEETVVHEILHHTERMLPEDLQAAVTKEWRKRIGEELKKATTPEQKTFLQNALTAQEPKKVLDDLIEGRVPGTYYQFVNPSEFWAMNASRIVSGRYAAFNAGMVQKAKRWLSEFIQKAKSVFGLQSDAPIIRGLDAVMKGDGTFVSNRMLADAEKYRAVSTQAPAAGDIEAAAPGITELRRAMLEAAGDETAFDPKVYAERKDVCKLTGHCNAAAYIVQKKYGGELLSARVQGETHVWNRLPDGTQVDLTGSQYGGDGFRPVAPSGKVVPPRATVNPRFKKFEAEVTKAMQAPTPSGITEAAEAPADLRQVDPTTGQVKGAVGQNQVTGRYVVTLFKNADPSTALHEVAHILRRTHLDSDQMQSLVDYAQTQGISVRHQFGEFTGAASDIEKAEELFAQAFERYVIDGVAPDTNVQAAFNRLMTSVASVYQGIQSTPLGAQLDPKMTALFDQVVKGAGRDVNQPLLPQVVYGQAVAASRPQSEGPLTVVAREANRLGLKAGFTTEALAEKLRASLAANNNNPKLAKITFPAGAKVFGKNEWTAEELSKLGERLAQEASEALGRAEGVGIDFGARGGAATIRELTPVERIRSALAARKDASGRPAESATAANVRATGRVFAATFFGGDIVGERGMRDVPVELRRDFDAATRNIEQGIGDTVTVLNDVAVHGNERELYEFLGGKTAVKLSSGRAVFSSGYDMTGAVNRMIVNLFQSLTNDKRDGLLALADAVNTTRPGQSIAQVGYKLTAQDIGDLTASLNRAPTQKELGDYALLKREELSKKMMEGAHSFLMWESQNGEIPLMKAIRTALGVPGVVRPDQEYKAIEAMLYVSGITPRNGAMFSGSSADATEILLRRLREIYTSPTQADAGEQVARQVAVLIGAYGQADRSKNLLVGLGLVVDKETRDAFVDFMNKWQTPEGSRPKVERLLARFGQNTRLVSDTILGADFYIPTVARERIAEALGKAQFTGRADTDVMAMTYRYMKTRMTRGSIVLRQKYFTANTVDHFLQMSVVAGYGPALQSVSRVLAQNVLVLPIWQQAVSIIRRTPVGRSIPPDVLEKIRVWLSSKGDQMANAIGAMVSSAKYRIEVNPILEGVDGSFVVGDRVYSYKELRNIAVEEGIFASLDTRELQNAILREGQIIMDSSGIKQVGPTKQGIIGSYLTPMMEDVRDVSEAWAERERLGAMVTLMEQGFDPRVAARLTIDALYDYSQTMTKADRAWWVGVVFPFWAFQKNANQAVFNLMLSPQGAYRMMCIQRARQRGTELLTELLYNQVGDDYGVDVENMPPELQQSYYAIITKVEQTYPDGVPLDVKMAMRLLLSGRPADVYGGQEVGVSAAIRTMRESGAFGDLDVFAPFVVARPEKSSRASYMRDRPGIAITPERNEMARFYYSLVGSNDHSYIELMLPESFIEAGMRHITYVAAAYTLLAAKAAGKAGVIPGETGIEETNWFTAVSPILDLERSPILGPMLTELSSGALGYPKRIDPVLAEPTLKAAEMMTKVHPTLGKMLDDMFGATFVRVPEVGDPIAMAVANGTDIREIAEERRAEIRALQEKYPEAAMLRRQRYYLPGGTWSTLFENLPIGELNNFLLRLEQSEMEKLTPSTEVVSWARRVLGLDVAEVSGSKTARQEEPTKLKSTKEI